MQKPLSLILLFFGLVLWSVQAQSQSKEVEISAQANSSKVRLGEPIVFTIRISWPGESTRFLIEEIKPPDLENLNIIQSSSELNEEESKEGKRTVKSYSFILSPDSSGPAKIGSLTVNYYDTATDGADSFTSQAIDIAVGKPSPLRGKSFLWFLLLVALLFLFGYLLRLYRKLKDFSSAKSTAALPEEGFLARLSSLSAQDQEDFYSSLRVLLTQFWEEKTRTKLSGKTTAEILARLEGASPEALTLTRELLEECDRVRFNPDLKGELAIEQAKIRAKKLLELSDLNLVKP